MTISVTTTREALASAVIAGASPEDLLGCPTPETTLAVCLRREDEERFLSEPEVDVRDTLHLEEVPLPELEPDEVLVAVMAAGLNYNTVWSAMFKPMSTFGFLDRLGKEGRAGARHAIDRHILGSDAAGVVVRAGSAVKHWRVGDEVVVNTLHTDNQDPITQRDGMLSERQRAWGFETNFGSLAHYTVAHATQLMRKPAHLTWEEAAGLTLCLMTAYRMLISEHGMNIRVGDLVLIWGATGGLGAFGTQLAKASGAQVVGIVSSPKKVRIAEANGCDLAIDRNQAREAHPDGLDNPKGWKWLGSLIRNHFGRDPEHVFEHVGRKTFPASVYLAARGGSVVTCGSSTGYQHDFDNRYLWMKLKRIIGSHGANYYEANRANELVRMGIIHPVLSKAVALADTADMCRSMQQNEHFGKISILSLSPEPGLGVRNHALREKIGEQRLNLFRVKDEEGFAL
jgi:crotonyl-CoA reductase